MMERRRVVIENVSPEVDCGRYPIRRVPGRKVTVTADIYSDGHDVVRSRLLFRDGDGPWRSVPMEYLSNDRWTGEFSVGEVGTTFYTIEGWIDRFRTWQADLGKKYGAGKVTGVDLDIGAVLVEGGAARAREAGSEADAERLAVAGARLREGEVVGRLKAALAPELAVLMDSYPAMDFATRYAKELPVAVDRPRAAFSAWYERFPRSCSPEPGRHGTLADCAAIIPEIARMGFDVFYLPPIHPIGTTNRKGANNNPAARPGDVGSPWAIGSQDGGHKSVHPDLGTVEDLERLCAAAKKHGVEVAMDLAFQCSPDHPYVKAHPEWFTWRPDGTVQYAENPPKKYEDIIPLNFETDACAELWEELRDVVMFWIDRGVRIFRVDNPHTKPFAFWEWLIGEVRAGHPDVIFLSEAFTRPRVKYRLAKIGFTQSYTYFTWRNTKGEIGEYIRELTTTGAAEYFRPSFWPNTPDILPEHLQFGGRPMFMARLVLAATLSSNYGIYGPPFELCVDTAVEGREEYLDSEKYEVRYWDWDAPGNLKDFIARVNRIRRENAALQQTGNIRFIDADNDFIISYVKADDEGSNIIVVAVNLDPYHPQSAWVDIPVEELGLGGGHPYLAHDLLTGDKYIWQGRRNYLRIDPAAVPAHILRIRKRLRREQDFDYFM